MSSTLEKPRSVRQSLEGFFQAIAKNQREGYRFVPFIGSGISKPAGYPLVSELNRNYLPYCIIRALRMDTFAEAPVADVQNVRWTPYSGIWPNMAGETVVHNRPRVTKEHIQYLLSQVPGSGFSNWIAERAKVALGS